ncbi:MAG: family 16 glycosylhydrolase [Myxococcota bacterium]
MRASLFALIIACSAATEPANPNPPTEPSPTTGSPDSAVLEDLALAVTVVGTDALNPHGDGSGVVQLVATATGAVRFTFDLGDGTTVESDSGEVEHTYVATGTNAFDVTVGAFTDDGSSASLTSTIEVYASSAEFQRLVWADEFDTDGALDGDKWHHQIIPPLDGGWFNNELQHYTERLDNSYVSDGTLKIVALRENYSVDGSLREFTSARLNSTFAFTYGRVEVRAKLPAEGGTWPAIWTLGANIDEVGNYHGTTYGSVGWPACGEIDILEQKGWDKQNTIAHFHWGNTQTTAYENQGGEVANPDATSAFHVYSLDWNAQRMRVEVDGQLVHELANSVDRPYDNAHYLLLNIAMGGNLGGIVPGDVSQATMEVDYVRVYQ